MGRVIGEGDEDRVGRRSGALFDGEAEDLLLVGEVEGGIGPCVKVTGAARADASYDRALGRLVSPELLIVDDLGLPWLRLEEPLDLYEVIRQRYEVGSLIVTTNRAVHEWYPLFGDDLLASAAMDRLLHHAHVVTVDGDSYRNPPRDRKVVNRPPENSRPERTVQP